MTGTVCEKNPTEHGNRLKTALLLEHNEGFAHKALSVSGTVAQETGVTIREKGNRGAFEFPLFAWYSHCPFANPSAFTILIYFFCL